jgi:hypothetical protein
VGVRRAGLKDFLDFAQRLLEIVRTAWIEHSKRERGMEHRDESDRQLILGYVHAHRRFRAIKRLAEDEQPSPEAINVLTRSARTKAPAPLRGTLRRTLTSGSGRCSTPTTLRLPDEGRARALRLRQLVAKFPPFLVGRISEGGYPREHLNGLL